jgi:hypothetical protein
MVRPVAIRTSASEKMEIKCPKCQAPQEVTVWKSLDVKSDPAIRDALFAWEINVFMCGQCDFRALIPVSLAYHDPVRHFCVQYHPVDALGTVEFYAGFLKDGSPRKAPGSADDAPDHACVPHLVFDLAEMLRYIAFREIAFEKSPD